MLPVQKSKFDPRAFDDRYEAAVEAPVKAKMEGRPIEPSKAPEPTPASDFMEALRQSAGREGSTPKRASRKANPEGRHVAELLKRTAFRGGWRCRLGSPMAFLVTISAMLQPITGTYRSRFCLMARASCSGIAAKLSGVRR